MLNTFKRFLRDGFSDSHTARRSRGRKRKLQVRNQTAIEALEAKTLLTATLQNYLTTEHVDLNLQHDGSEWAIGPRNSDQFPAIQYANDEAVMYVGAPAEITRPGSSDFDFMGVESGESLFYLPQSQDTELIFAGFAAYGLGSSVDSYNPVDESKGRVNGSTRWAKTTLTDVRHTKPDGTTGDGEFSLWQAGTFGQITVLMASCDDGQDNANSDGLDVTDGISGDDAMWIPAGGHNHFNFGFTEPGRYEVDVKLSAYFGDDGNNSTANAAGYSESDDITLYFSVMSVGELQFEQSSYSVNEDAGTASIDVVRTGGSDGRITVDYATSDGTATEPGDYTAASGTLEFLDGEIRKTITVPIIDDADEEGDESFTIELSNAGPENIDDYLTDIEGDTNGLLGTITSTTVTISGNDQPVNTPPTISDVVDQVVEEGNSTADLAFTVGDSETSAAALTVTATSSNTTLVPNGNITLGGSGANRTVTVAPAANQTGTTTITLTVTDAGGLTATDTFVLTVNAANGNPTISAIGDVVVGENSNSSVSFTIGDAETAAGDLVVVATSANMAVVPDANLVLGGTGTNRTLTITPAADQSGSTTITVTVTDGGGLQATETFDVAVISGLVPFSMPIASGQGQSQQLKSVDFTGDGIADVIAAAGFAGSLIFLEGVGNGSFVSDVALNHGSDMYSGDLAEIDFDGDGDLDIVAGEYDADTLNGLTMDGQLALYRNDGSGQFTREILRGGLPQVADTTVADLNGDDFGDIVF